MIQDQADTGRRADGRTLPLSRYLPAITLASGLVSAAGVATLAFAAASPPVLRYGLPLAFLVFAACSATMIATLRRGHGSQAWPRPDGRHDVLVREIQHRVKNNLQVITSLISLQSSNAVDPSTRHALEETKRRVLVMSRAHENLYQSLGGNRVDANAFIKAVAKDAGQVHRLALERIELELDVGAVDLDIDRAVALGQIASELLANAFTHAFPEPKRGRVYLCLRCDDDGQCRLSVQDEGVGLPADLDWQQVNSLGLRLVRQLAERLDGRVEFAPLPRTRFEIVLPMEKS